MICFALQKVRSAQKNCVKTNINLHLDLSITGGRYNVQRWGSIRYREGAMIKYRPLERSRLATISFSGSNAGPGIKISIGIY